MGESRASCLHALRGLLPALLQAPRVLLFAPLLQGLMPLGVMVSGIGFTFSLMYATQGIVNTLSEMRRASGALSRVRAH